MFYSTPAPTITNGQQHLSFFCKNIVVVLFVREIRVYENIFDFQTIAEAQDLAAVLFK